MNKHITLFFLRLRLLMHIIMSWAVISYTWAAFRVVKRFVQVLWKARKSAKLANISYKDALEFEMKEDIRNSKKELEALKAEELRVVNKHKQLSTIIKHLQ